VRLQLLARIEPMRALTGVLVVSALAIGGLGWLYREAIAHGFSAREKPWAAEAWVARSLRQLAIGTDARAMINPLAPDAATLAEARDHFADHCAVCHANDGSGHTRINAGLYPPAPDMREEGTQRLSDGELFRIIENGIRFTGMPGWGGSPDENWALVLFIRHLPDLTVEELEFMREIHPDEAPTGASHG
jgi:mono/diheme cytochrome c family protein